MGWVGFPDITRADLSAAGYRAGWALTARLPQSVARRLFDALADLASKRGKGPEQLRRNLARVVGPENVTRDLVRRAMRSYLRYWREAFQLPILVQRSDLGERLSTCIDETSVRRLERSISSGRGVILALPHTGNWDMAGVYLVHAFGTFATVAERLRPESLFEAFVNYRKSLGFEVLALSGGEQPPMQRLEEVLRSGGTVCLLGERDLTGRGVVVDFFGEPAALPTGPARLALNCGAALHVVHIAFEGSAWRMLVGEEIDVAGIASASDGSREAVTAMTQAIADGFAANIARWPEDWHMLQKVWLADVSDSARTRVAEGEQGAGA
ncbi:phosphatidylinositol mannoside acyltransferase [Corynebacterium heidelbergense]|uniref:phosphatidylinositol mannoside acyltransferase n=1 Tax=Corynebacterium heidelbergense TaxID=2055947 RepID=UPI0015EF5120|nr:phosphatidylinositol mannoside acyltransferase [Corynebacterium heidelbergense]WCZ36639.1 Phosphatidylinositol mannoside acyltransferase [Corynebacterium heidelbergense]